MTDLPLELLDRMADAARARADLWELCRQAVARPTVEWVEQLRTGRVGQRLERDTVWLGESVDVGDLVAALGAYVGRSGRFTPAQDLAELEGEWARAVADDAVEAVCGSQRDAARREADAWEAGDAAAARAARASQHAMLCEAFEPMQGWCRRVYADTHVLVVKVLAETMAAHVGFELGRDLRKSLDPGSRARLVME